MGLRTAVVCKSLLARRTPSWPRAAWPRRWATSTRGQLEGALPRHHARRQAPQQLPDGRAPRQGGAGPRPRAGAWGALFDRTADGLILQRDFGGHRFARLAHVGDRTGLELIRTMQQKAVADGMEVFMELKVLRLLQRRRRQRVRPRGLLAPDRQIRGHQGQGRRARHRRRGQSWMYTSNSWESTGDGHAMALWAGADLIDMECVQFHPTGHGLAPVGARHPRDRGRPRRRRRPPQLRGHAVHVRLRARHVPGRDGRLRGRGRQVVRRPHRRPPATGAAAPRRGRPLDQLRGQGRPRQPARRGVPRHRHPALARGHPSPPAVHVPPVQGAGRRRHHRRGHGGRSDLPLHHGRRARRRRHHGGHRARAVRRRRGGRRHARANRLGGNSLSDLLVFGRRPASAPPSSPGTAPAT